MNEKELEFAREKEQGDAEMIEIIDTVAEEIKGEIIEQRNYLHQNPELGLAPETAKYIVERLKDLGLEVKKGIAETGVVATLRGQNERPSIIFKASLDAVAALDESPESPRSKVPNVSHACGHDVAMSYLLGCAEILSKIPERKGTVKFLFQPNEERAVIQESYAKKMADEGAVKGADAIFELHPIALPEEIALSPEGRMNAASGRYKIMVHPKEEDILAGKTPDANTLLSVITAKMGKHEPRPEQLKDVLVRTPFHICKKEGTLEELAEKFDIPAGEFMSFKITLKGPGGHAGVSKEAANLNFLSSKIISKLYEKYGNSLLSFSESVGKPAYNVLPTQKELWVSLRGKDKSEEFQQDVEKAVNEVTVNLPSIKKVWQEEKTDKVPFASQAESYSTIRVGEEHYLGPRKDIFTNLHKILIEEMKKSGLTKPKFVEGAEEKMPCPKGEWRLYFQKGTPPQFNDSELIKLFDEAARSFGIKHFDKNPITSGTDFCYFGATEKIPSAQVLLGSITEQDFTEKLNEKLTGHITKVEFTKDSIRRGAKILALIAQKFWERKAGKKS